MHCGETVLYALNMMHSYYPFQIIISFSDSLANCLRGIKVLAV